MAIETMYPPAHDEMNRGSPAAIDPTTTPEGQQHQEHEESEKTTTTPTEKLQPLGTQLQKLKIEDFELIKTLGTGTFARVWLTRFRDPRRGNGVYALKTLRKADVIKLKQVEHVRNERKSLAAVAGFPFITNLAASFSDDECLYMLLDYCPGGEIFTYLRRARRFNEPTTRFYAAEITLTIEYLHDVQGVAYRDLKPENILLDAQGHIKLVDFGFAKQVGDRETYTLCGTPDYLAPEVIHNSGHGLAVDWWALGILIYEFLVGQPPFWDPNVMRLYEQIVAGQLHFPQGLSLAARDIISQLCRTNVAQRLGYISGGSARVKSHPFFDGINWDDLYYRRVPGPIVPQITHPADASNFEEYPPPPDPSTLTVYTDDMREKYDALFADFDS